MLISGYIGFNVRSAATAIVCLLAPFAHGQTREAEAAKNACSPIIAEAVTSQTSIDRQQFDSDATTSWLCSQSFSSEEEASQAGIDISGVLKGVRIGLLYSSDQQRRAQSRSALLSAPQRAGIHGRAGHRSGGGGGFTHRCERSSRNHVGSGVSGHSQPAGSSIPMW